MRVLGQYIKKRKLLLLVLCAFFANVSTSLSQTLPVGIPALEDYYRRIQLIDTLYQHVSFTIRPLTPKKSLKTNFGYYPDSIQRGYNLLLADSKWESKNGLKASLLPLQSQIQFNSSHPYGWNDGPLIPSKGLQTLLSAGIYSEWGPLSIQFQPEIVLANNSPFEGFSEKHYDVLSARYYDFYNQIDLPERFGNEAYGEAYWGQSSIKLNFDPISIGFSTENLWWGPGIGTSLLMSNTAPGFKHFTIQTNKPIQTKFGSFESQIIAGRPQSSGYGVLEPERTYFGNPLYVPKASGNRYLSGIIFTWQPKWIKGLFLGFNRTLQLYSEDQNNRISDYLPLFSPFQPFRADAYIKSRQQMGGVFFRWLWPESQMEIYGEWARHNQADNLKTDLLEPERSRAYVFGLRKALKTTNPSAFFLIAAEVTQLQETNLTDIRRLNSWYINSSIRQGYTNKGQLIGAGIGPGANLQQVGISWINGLNRIGLQVERYLHNNDFYYYAYEDSFDFRRHWFDLSLKANGEWSYQNLIFNSQIVATRSYNYGWYLMQNPGDPYFINGLNKFNLQIQVGATYRF